MENFARVGRKFKLDQIQANSSLEVGGETKPNSFEVVNLARVGLSWDCLARTLEREMYICEGSGNW